MSRTLEYPTGFVDEVSLLPNVDQAELNAKGLYVVQGLTVALAEQLAGRSQEPEVRDYCPNDYIRKDNGKPGRFHDLGTTAKWLGKKRLPLPLINDDKKLMGMAWMGPERPKPEEGEPAIEGATTTFAIRIYEGATGQRNALPYTKAILEAHGQQFGNDGAWLEAWGDNAKALKPYQKAGFIEVGRIMGERNGEPKERVYMTLGNLSVAA